MAGPVTRLGGFRPAQAPLVHRVLSKVMGGGMFFWIMYRLREDGAVWLGLKHPWDGHGHGHGDEHH